MRLSPWRYRLPLRRRDRLKADAQRAMLAVVERFGRLHMWNVCRQD